MKSMLLTLLVVLGLACTAILLPAGCRRGAPAHGAAVQYHCPMHPTVVADRPGDCPICGMQLVPVAPETKAPANTPAAPAKKILYRSTMNPNEVSDHPGKDSMGMELVPVAATGGGEPTPAGLAAVSIPAAVRARMGLTLGAVERRPLTRELRAAAAIVADETRLYHVTVKIEGYVERLFTATTGAYIKQGEPLVTIYSPALVSAQQEYLNVLQRNPELAAAARQRLQLWDITDEQIDRLARSGKPERVVTLYAPASGWIMERNIAAGHKVMAGEQLLVLADLSSVWADAAVYQSDLPQVQLGMPVTLTVSAVPGQALAGRVSFIAPALDPATRTVTVRMAVPNPGLLLKPAMYGVARLAQELGERLAIPAAAVLRTGEHTYAFRDAGDDRLVPVEIRLGARSGDWFELLGGLQAGDQVVTSANFLVDSESAMKAALAALGGGSGK